MKYKIKNKCRIAVLLIAIAGMLVPLTCCSSKVKADAIDGVELVANNYDINMDKDGDGYIRADGSDHVRIEWLHDYPGSTYLMVNRNPKKTLDGGGLESMEFMGGDAVSKYFKTGQNSIKIWHGSNKGYSELIVSFPIPVDSCPLEFLEKPDKRSFPAFVLIKNLLCRFSLFEMLFNL